MSPFGAGSGRKFGSSDAARFLGLFDELRAAEAKGGRPQMASRLTDTEINDYMR